MNVEHPASGLYLELRSPARERHRGAEPDRQVDAQRPPGGPPALRTTHIPAKVHRERQDRRLPRAMSDSMSSLASSGSIRRSHANCMSAGHCRRVAPDPSMPGGGCGSSSGIGAIPRILMVRSESSGIRMTCWSCQSTPSSSPPKSGTQRSGRSAVKRLTEIKRPQPGRPWSGRRSKRRRPEAGGRKGSAGRLRPDIVGAAAPPATGRSTSAGANPYPCGWWDTRFGDVAVIDVDPNRVSHARCPFVPSQTGTVGQMDDPGGPVRAFAAADSR